MKAIVGRFSLATICFILATGAAPAPTAEQRTARQQADLEAAYNKRFAESELKASELYDFADKPDSEGGKRMKKIDDDLEAIGDPLFNSPDKPLIIAQMVAKEIRIAPKSKPNTGGGTGDVDTLAMLRTKAESGDAVAQFNLGGIYNDGYGVAKDSAVAAKWYRLAAAQGDVDARFKLGWMYANGEGVLKDSAEAAKWYRMAAVQGNATAQCNLGWMYANGEGVLKDSAVAVFWYRKAADQGNAFGQFNVGVMYANGEGVPKDIVEAANWYLMAAAQGYAAAQNNLGWMYDTGYGVAKDSAEAAKWYRMAAAQGYATAQNNLALMYANGEGVPKHSGEAVSTEAPIKVDGQSPNSNKSNGNTDTMAILLALALITVVPLIIAYHGRHSLSETHAAGNLENLNDKSSIDEFEEAVKTIARYKTVAVPVAVRKQVLQKLRDSAKSQALRRAMSALLEQDTLPEDVTSDNLRAFAASVSHEADRQSLRAQPRSSSDRGSIEHLRQCDKAGVEKTNRKKWYWFTIALLTWAGYLAGVIMLQHNDRDYEQHPVAVVSAKAITSFLIIFGLSWLMARRGKNPAKAPVNVSTPPTTCATIDETPTFTFLSVWENIQRKRIVTLAKRSGLSRICVALYVAFVVGSLFYAPWEGWGYTARGSAISYTRRVTRFGTIFTPPANLCGSDPYAAGNYLRARNTPPRLKTEQLVLLWGALGIATVAIVWLRSSKKTATDPSVASA